MKKNLVLAAVALLMVAGVMVVKPGRASADLSNCFDPGYPHTKLCMWTDANYSGGWFAVVDPPVGTCQSVATGYNDLTSSIYNRTNNTLYYYQNGGCSGYLGLVSAHNATPYVGDAANDKISSYLLN